MGKIGRKQLKDVISISVDKGMLRLRWSNDGERFSLNLFEESKTNFKNAKFISLHIEDDIDTGGVIIP